MWLAGWVWCVGVYVCAFCVWLFYAQDIFCIPGPNALSVLLNNARCFAGTFTAKSNLTSNKTTSFVIMSLTFLSRDNSHGNRVKLETWEKPC